MNLPQPLPRFELGEVLGYLRTKGHVPFLDAAGEEILASIWFVVCTDRCWLVAGTGDQRWSVADTSVQLDKGWTWDALKVGAWSTPLRTGTRQEASALIRKWNQAPKGGAPIVPSEPVGPTTTATVARGMHGLPSWIETVEAPAEAFWLFGFKTGRAHALFGRDGSLHHEPVWFLFSDQHQVLATESGWRRSIQEVRLVERTARRDLLVVDGWTVPGSGLSEPYTTVANELASAPPAERWAIVLRFQVDQHHMAEASQLLAHGYLVERHTSSWDTIGQLALATGHLEEAVLAVRQLLCAHPEINLRRAAVRWLKHRPVGAIPVPAGLFADAEPLQLPEGLPWPVEGAMEVFGTAALLCDRSEEGLELWAHRGRGPRALQAGAAIAGRAGHPSAWALWVEAAESWRPVDGARGRQALQRALVVAPEDERPALHWRLGAWCYADGVEVAPHWRHAVQSPPPMELVQSAAGWRRAAVIAEQEECFSVAVLAWSKVWSIDVFEIEALQRTVQLAEKQLGDPELALRSLVELEERCEAMNEPDPPLYEVCLEQTRVALSLNQVGVAEEALRRAVEGDFLVVEAWDWALSLGEELLYDEQQRWYRHLRDVLVGVPTEGLGPLRHHLGEAALDALHPGGVGWLERARQSVDAASPPDRGELVRGLERMEAERWPVLSGAVEEASRGLGISAPEVFLFRGEGAWGLSAWPTDPPLILVGHDHLREGHPLEMSRDALRFALAVELTHLAAKHPLLAFDGGLVGTSRSVYEAFGRYAGTAETVVDVITLLPGVDQLAKIQTLIKLSKRVFSARSVVDKASEVANSSLGFLGWSSDDTMAVGRTFEGVALQFRLQADRAALLLSGDLLAAVEAILVSDPLAAAYRGDARSKGIVSILHLLPADARLRVASLLGFAATLHLPIED